MLPQKQTPTCDYCPSKNRCPLYPCRLETKMRHCNYFKLHSDDHKTAEQIRSEVFKDLTRIFNKIEESEERKEEIDATLKNHKEFVRYACRSMVADLKETDRLAIDKLRFQKKRTKRNAESLLYVQYKMYRSLMLVVMN